MLQFGGMGVFMEEKTTTMTFICCDIPLVSTDNETITKIILANLNSNSAQPIRLVNAYSVVCAQQNPEYLEFLKDFGINLIDSRNIARIYGVLLKRSGQIRQIRGYNLLLSLLSDKGSQRNVFIGSSEQVLSSMERRISKEFPWHSDSIYISPKYSQNYQELIEDICERFVPSKNDVIWISLGTPKQDFVCSKLALKWGCTVIAVGAAFDFFGGNIKNAPKWISDMGLEWMFRLTLEPKRLWRRYIIGNSKFIIYFFLSLIKNTNRQGNSI